MRIRTRARACALSQLTYAGRSQTALFSRVYTTCRVHWYCVCVCLAPTFEFLFQSFRAWTTKPFEDDKKLGRILIAVHTLTLAHWSIILSRSTVCVNVRAHSCVLSSCTGRRLLTKCMSIKIHISLLLWPNRPTCQIKPEQSSWITQLYNLLRPCAPRFCYKDIQEGRKTKSF